MAISDHAGAAVEVLRTTDASLLPVVTALLESAGIPFWVAGEEMVHLLPIQPGMAPFSDAGIEAVVRVDAARAEEAKALLESAVAVGEPLPEELADPDE